MREGTGASAEVQAGSDVASLEAVNKTLNDRLMEAELLCDEAASRHDESECIIVDLKGRLHDALLSAPDAESAAVRRCKAMKAQLAEEQEAGRQIRSLLAASKAAAAQEADVAAAKLADAGEQLLCAQQSAKSLQTRLEAAQKVSDTARAAFEAEKAQMMSQLSASRQAAAAANARCHAAERKIENVTREAAAVEARAKALRLEVTAAEEASKAARRRALCDAEIAHEREAALERTLSSTQQQAADSSLQLARLEARGKTDAIGVHRLAAQVARAQQRASAAAARSLSDSGQEEKAASEAASETMSVFSEGYLSQVARCTEQETSGEVSRLLSALNAAAADAEAERAVSSGLLAELRETQQQQAAFEGLLANASAQREEIVHLKQVVNELRDAEDAATNSAVAEAGRAEGLATLLGVIDGLMAHARPLLAPPPPPALEYGNQPASEHEQQLALEHHHHPPEQLQESERLQAVQDATAAANVASAAVSEAMAAASRQEAEATVAAARRFAEGDNAGCPRLPSIAHSAAGREVLEILSSSSSDRNMTPDSDRLFSAISGLAPGEALTDEPSTPMVPDGSESDKEAAPHDSMETQQHLRLSTSREQHCRHLYSNHYQQPALDQQLQPWQQRHEQPALEQQHQQERTARRHSYQPQLAGEYSQPQEARGHSHHQHSQLNGVCQPAQATLEHRNPYNHQQLYHRHHQQQQQHQRFRPASARDSGGNREAAYMAAPVATNAFKAVSMAATADHGAARDVPPECNDGGRGSTPLSSWSSPTRVNPRLRRASMPRGEDLIKAAAAQEEPKQAAPFSRRVSFSGLGPLTPSTVEWQDGEEAAEAGAALEPEPALQPHPMKPLWDLSNGNLHPTSNKGLIGEQPNHRSSKETSHLFAAMRRRFSGRNRDH